MNRLTGCTILLRPAQTALLIFGLLLAYFGWALDEGIWPATVYASGYSRVIAGYERMKQHGALIKPEDPAFDDLAALITEQFPNLESAISTEHDIRVTSYSNSTFGIEGPGGPSFDLTVILETGESVGLDRMGDIGDLIHREYLDRPISRMATLFFSLGLGLAFAGGVLGIWKPTRRDDESVID